MKKKRVKAFLIKICPSIDTELLKMTEDEKAFLTAFKNREFKPELLFKEQGIIDRLKMHPMIEWKISKQ